MQDLRFGLRVLAKSQARRKEMAIRLALGSSRLRLIRQLLTENLLLSLLGAGLGLVPMRWLLQLLPKLMPPSPIPIDFELGIDVGILGFTLLLSFATTLLVALLPAIHASKPDLVPLLKNESSGAGERRRKRKQAKIPALATPFRYILAVVTVM